MFGNSGKNFEIFKFSSNDRHIDMENGRIYSRLSLSQLRLSRITA